ncbi:MAG: hypothetical protein IT291_03210 [Deltaproteobacteria bacterium]|nr:hypothetical protein [Deltaproteobacteria bacterium]
MKNILAILEKTKGVMGSAIFDEHYGCQEHSLQPPYNASTLSKVVRQVEELAAINSSISDSDNISSFAATFERASVLIRHVHNLYLVVIFENSVNTSMISVALNAASMKLEKSAASVSISPARVSASRKGTISTNLTKLNSLETNTPPVRPRSPSGNLQALLDEMPDKAQRIPRDAVGEAMINHILKTCVHYFGSNAVDIIKQELEALGVTPRTLRIGQVADLLHGLAVNLPGAGQREEFLAKALGDQVH